jgi:hypothetical protein
MRRHRAKDTHKIEVRRSSTMFVLNRFLLWRGIRLVGAAYLTEWSRLPNASALDRHHANELGRGSGGAGGMSPKSVLEFAGRSSLNCDIPKRDDFFSEIIWPTVCYCGNLFRPRAIHFIHAKFHRCRAQRLSQIEGYVSCKPSLR